MHYKIFDWSKRMRVSRLAEGVIEGPKKLSWMKSVRGFLHGRLWITFHDFSHNLCHAHLQEVGMMQIMGDCVRLNTKYGLWMRVKGPHKYMVMALGLCMKSPSVACTLFVLCEKDRHLEILFLCPCIIQDFIVFYSFFSNISCFATCMSRICLNCAKFTIICIVNFGQVLHP